jgi:hypothetical protein
MNTIGTVAAPHIAEHEWIPFPGGELEGKRPRVLCLSCRAKLSGAAQARAPLGPSGRRGNTAARNSAGNLSCFQCYRAELERDRAIKAAGEIDTASEDRFQSTLPFEPVNKRRLDTLRASRAEARISNQTGAGQYVDRRRHAQIAARHALQQIAAGVAARSALGSNDVTTMYASPQAATRAWDAAVHAAELQLPEAWLPFVVSR